MLCIIAKLDDAAVKRLTSIRESALIEEAAIKRLYGHITIAAYSGNNEAGFVQDCKKLLADISPFSVKYTDIEVLWETSIIIARPETTLELKTIHQLITEKYNDSLNQWTKKGAWYPHTTLFYEPQSDLRGLCSRMAESFVPFSTIINRIEFSTVTEAGYRIIDSMRVRS